MTAAERTRSLQDRVALVAGATRGAGRAMFRIGFDTHAITSHFALPLLIRHPDGLVVEDDRRDCRVQRRLPAPRRLLLRPSQGRRAADDDRSRLRASPGPGIGSGGDSWLDAIRGHARLLWSDRVDVARCYCAGAAFLHLGITCVYRAVTALAADPDVARWSGQVVSSGQLARVYGFTDTDGTQPDCWRYLVEVQDKNLPADDRGYR